MTRLLLYINMYIEFHICNSLPSSDKAYSKEMQMADKLVYSQIQLSPVLQQGRETVTSKWMDLEIQMNFDSDTYHLDA